MKVNYLIACDAAVRTSNKLNLLGIFSSISVRSLPARHGQLAIVAEINAEPGEHEFRYVFKDTEGKDAAPATPPGKFKVENVGLGEVVAELRQFPVARAGFLSIQLEINGKVVAQRDILVRLEGQAPASS
ncbi:MAG: hypothetical protein HUU15_17290 [Candidatus Brocadiae bacterium]|nr:hypothetical protein [Candidatus Brocadiia bacterium]